MGKKRLVGFILTIAVCILFGDSDMVFANGKSNSTINIISEKIENFDDMQDVINKYVFVRKQIVSKEIKEEDARFLLEKLTLNNNIIERELERDKATDNLKIYHNVYAQKIESFISIQSIIQSILQKEEYTLDVYEWTWITYDNGKIKTTDIMGYATEHKITMCKDENGGYKIIDDVYDESDILGIPNFASEDNNDEYNNIAITTHNGINSSSNVDYNVVSAIDYADKWVIHEYSNTTMQNASYYNLTTYGYYSADCANFVSQCIRSGGMAWDYGNGKDNSNWDGTQWWFDINPNPNYENYNVSPPSWRKVSKFIEYWQNQGYNIVAATESTVFPGNPVVNNNSHVGICVGYNSAGIPIINAHNRDVYHVPFTMIGSGTKNTIQISVTNKMIYKPTNAVTIYPTTTSQTTPIQVITTGANRYYKFTVLSTGYYTFESTYYNNTYDTYAYLYKENLLSNGQTLYMYEVARNDDGGSGLNFKIREYLTPGTYYLRVRGYGSSTSGYFYLNYMQN